MTRDHFDITATNACKGIALLLLLWHHLFFQNPEVGVLAYRLARLAKVCVAIFVLLSGYGLAATVARKPIGLLNFYKDRLAGLYLNYWLIAALFVPVGVLCIGRTFADVFTTHPCLKFAVQMTGLHRFVYLEYGYNATWWFMSMIIPLYLLFPLIHWLIRRYGIWFLLLCFSFAFTGDITRESLQVYLFPFALGVFLFRCDAFVKGGRTLNRTGLLRFPILLCALAAVAVFRQRGVVMTRETIDWLFGALLILLTFELVASLPILRRVLSFLGRHLFNVFLFHTFIYKYYFSDIIYAFRHPVLIFAALLAVCIGVSLLIEALKKLIGFHKLLAAIRGFCWRDRVTI